MAAQVDNGMRCERKASADPSQHRVIQLDILRGIAILLVLGRHAVVPSTTAGFLFPFAEFWHRFGWTGVDLFFVLSGFLIGGLLFSELRATGRLNVGRFLIRRGFKIWPAYYLLLAYCCFMAVGARYAVSTFPYLTQRLPALRAFMEQNPSFFDWRAAVPNLFHLQNYLGLIRLHTWSLAVEEHFYLALPVLLYLLTRGQRKPLAAIPAIPWIAGVVVVGCTMLRCLPSAQVSAGPDPIYYQTHLRLDGLFFGVLLAYLYHFEPAFLERLARRRGLLLLLGTALISPMFFIRSHVELFVPTLGFTMLYLGFGCILLALLYTPLGETGLGRMMSSRPARGLAYVGLYSYSIYLWHIDLARVPIAVLSRAGSHLPAELSWVLFMAMYVCAASVAGIVMGKMIEMPMLRIRDRLYPRGARSVSAVRSVEKTEDHQLIGTVERAG